MQSIDVFVHFTVYTLYSVNMAKEDNKKGLGNVSVNE